MGFSHLPELLIIMVVALIVFGPSRLPEVGSSIGKAMREFRRATSEIEDAVMQHADAQEEYEDAEFPHIPPAPDEPSVEALTPTVDTLAMRRAARHQAREVAAAETAERPVETQS
jgi:TatA/E family protein of Tat protein translocase